MRPTPLNTTPKCEPPRSSPSGCETILLGGKSTPIPSNQKGLACPAPYPCRSAAARPLSASMDGTALQTDTAHVPQQPTKARQADPAISLKYGAMNNSHNVSRILALTVRLHGTDAEQFLAAAGYAGKSPEQFLTDLAKWNARLAEPKGGAA